MVLDLVGNPEDSFSCVAAQIMTAYFIFQAYKIDVFQSGKFHSLDKRYSEFEELHKQVLHSVHPEMLIHCTYEHSHEKTYLSSLHVANFLGV